MVRSKTETQAILSVVRTAKIVDADDGLSQDIVFSWEDEKGELKWVSQDELVFNLKGKLKELENE